MHAILIEDMNLIAAGEGRLDAATGAIRPERHDRAGYIEERFPEFAEIVAEGFSRRQFRSGELDILSRIDRVMMNSHTADLDSVRASARHVSSVVDVTIPSDHVAVELVLSLPARGSRRTIPRWIIDHPLFSALCDEIIPDLELDLQRPFDAIARTVAEFHKVAQQVRHTGRPVSSCRAHAWLAHWLLAARSAHQRGDEKGVRSALARLGAGEFDAMFINDAGNMRAHVDEDKFARKIGRLRVAHIMGDMRGEMRAAETSEEKSAVRARAHRRMARWSPTRRRIHRMTVLAGDGSSLGCGREAAGSLAAHWGPAFSEARGVSQVAADRFLQFAPRFDAELHMLAWSSATLRNMLIAAVQGRTASRTMLG